MGAFHLRIQGGKMGNIFFEFELNLDSSPIINPTLELQAFLESLELDSSTLNSPPLIVGKGLMHHLTQSL